MSEESLSNQTCARSLMVAGGSAALATLKRGAGPFASYVVTRRPLMDRRSCSCRALPSTPGISNATSASLLSRARAAARARRE